MSDTVYLTAVPNLFLAMLCGSFFEMKLLMDIWAIQAPERSETSRRIAVNNTDETRIEEAAPATERPRDSPGLPLPAIAQGQTESVILPPDQDLEAAGIDDTAQDATQTTVGSARREMGSVYLRFYFILAFISILSLWATTWPTALRSLYINVLAFGYLSCWVPQIYRNTMRNSRRALRFEFVVGQSLIRLAPFVYFYTVSDNVLSVTVDRNTAYVFTAWVWIQVWALISQEILGPWFFIRNGWAPPAYDYHPILREDDEESSANLPLRFTQATSRPSSPASKLAQSKESGKRVFDCAICMQDLEVPVVPADGDQNESGSVVAASILSRRTYMVTPCRYKSH